MPLTLNDVLTTALGTFFGLFPPAAYFIYTYLTNARKNKYIGEWCVFSYSGDQSIGWVPHKLTMRAALKGGFKFICKGDAAGYLYSGSGDILNGYFSGDWESTNHGASSRGTFNLMGEPLGRFFAGYYCGPAASGKPMFHPWVICRKQGDFGKALGFLKDSTFHEQINFGFKITDVYSKAVV